MIAVLEEAFAQARQLPDAQQDAVATILLEMMDEMKREKAQATEPGRKAGSAKGLGYMTADFDEPLKDCKDYM